MVFHNCCGKPGQELILAIRPAAVPRGRTVRFLALRSWLGGYTACA